MSQQINLFNPMLRKRRLALSMLTAVICLGITVVMLFAVQFTLQRQTLDLQAEVVKSKGMLDSQLAALGKLKEANALRQKDTSNDAEIARLETELKRGRGSLDALQNGAVGSRDGFAGYFLAFSRQSIDGLWLTGFSIKDRKDISIQGRATRADLLPYYIQNLRKEQLFQGHSFAALKIGKPEQETASAAPDGRSRDEEQRYLEFILTTFESAVPAAGARSAR